MKKKDKVKISKDTKEVVETLTQEAKKAEKVAEKIMFVSKIKQLGMAIGGALLFLGFITYAIVGLITLDKFPIPLSEEYKIIVSVFLAIIATLHTLGGIALISK